MLTFAIIGRPNVGKSTLFNVLTKTRNALVANESGLTRDRQFGKGQVGNRDYWLVDTGGLGNEKGISEYVAQQALLAARESTAIFFMVDGREGLTTMDENIAQNLRSLNTPIYLIINKIDGVDETVVSTEFHILGFEKIFYISASHQRGIQHLMNTVLSDFSEYPEDEEIEDNQGIKIAIVGRPNVGKSTLVNRILGEERVIVSEEAGTTRDSIAVPFERKGQRYVLIDTAGVRRRAKVVQESIEKISIIKTLQSIEIADVVVLLLDAQEGVTDQDASLLGQILYSGTALVIAVNKWDGLNDYQQEQARKTLSRKLHFVDFVDIHFMSALKGNGIGTRFFQSIFTAWTSANCKLTTNQLNQVLKNGVIAHEPPLVKGKRIRLRYIHQGGQHPPLFVIHGNNTLILPDSYKRYLTNLLREKFALKGTSILLEFKQGENPYDTPEKHSHRNNR